MSFRAARLGAHPGMGVGHVPVIRLVQTLPDGKDERAWQVAGLQVGLGQAHRPELGLVLMAHREGVPAIECVAIATRAVHPSPPPKD